MTIVLSDTRIMTWEEFKEEFKPMKNTYRQDDRYDGCMFETYGSQLNHVNLADKLRVWTLLSSGNCMSICEGWHFVDRMGYFITEVARTEDDHCEYIIDEDVWEDEVNE